MPKFFSNFPKTPQGLFSQIREAAKHSARFLVKLTIEAIKGLGAVKHSRPHHALKIFKGLTRKDLLTLTGFVLLIAFGSILVRASGRIPDGQPDFGGEYTEGLVGQPQFLNPVLSAASGVDSDITRIIYAQLLKFDKDLKLIPDLAENLPTISADQKTYTIKLKPNLKWQDGRAILSDDVVYTVQTIQNSAFESPLRANFSRVKIEKVDDLTINFVLREVSASFIINLTLAPLPRHMWENLPPTNFRLTDLNLKPIGSGPFVVRELKKTSDGTVKSITLKANDNYYAGRPFLDRIIFKFYLDYDGLINAYQSKEIQGIGYLPFDKKMFVESSDRLNQHRINIPQYQAVFFNLSKNSVLIDKAVRQGLWLATNRQTVIDEVYGGFARAASGPILEGNLGYNPQVAERTHTDLNEAAAILDKAGWVLDPETGVRAKSVSGGKKPLEFTLATNNFVLNVKTAQILQKQWEQLGVNVRLTIVSANELEQQYIRPRNFDALLFSENTGADPDPFAFWHSSQSRDPGLNLSGFSNAEVDRLLTTARQTFDTNVRDQNYKQFQMIVTDSIPAIFLDSAVFVYNLPKKLQGVEFSTIIAPSERFWNIHQWYIETR